MTRDHEPGAAAPRSDAADGTRLLGPLRDGPAPEPSTVSIARALRAGRRTRTRRRVGVALAAGFVAMAVALLPAFARGLVDGPAERPAAAQAPTEFDVWRQAFRVGSAAGFTPLTYQTGRYRQRVYLGPAAGGEAAGEAGAVVSMYARDRLPVTTDPSRLSGARPAPDVHGSRAFWMADPVTGTGGVEMAWEWSRGAWAFARVTGPDARAKVHRVAQSVQPGADEAVAVPFTLPQAAVPPPYRLVGTVTAVADHSILAALLFAPGEEPSTDGDLLLVGVQRGIARDLLTGGPKAAPTSQTTVGGRTLAVDGTRVTVIDLDSGFAGGADARSAEVVDQLGGRQRLVDIATAVRLVADPADRRTWVDRPLR